MSASLVMHLRKKESLCNKIRVCMEGQWNVNLGTTLAVFFGRDSALFPSLAWNDSRVEIKDNFIKDPVLTSKQ